MRDDPADYALMARWLTDERVLEFYEGRDDPYPLERVIEKYGPRVRGEEPVASCLILYREQPIGYVQYYALAPYAESFSIEDARDTFGIDIFIGEPDHWDRGIGTEAVSAMLAYLLDELSATRAVIDPRVDNPRAVRCYEKAGFRKVMVLPKHELHEGEYRDAWLMTIERARTK